MLLFSKHTMIRFSSVTVDSWLRLAGPANRRMAGRRQQSRGCYGSWRSILVGTLLVMTAEVWAQPADSSAPTEASDPAAVEFFEQRVRPLLLEHCAGCHSEKVGKTMGGLSLDSRQALLAGGDSGPAIDLATPDASLLLEAVRREALEMRPDKPLSRTEVDVLLRWLTSGAVWPDSPPPASEGDDWLAERAAEHWAWQPPVEPAIPAVGNSDWPLGPIDAFILQRLDQQNLQPAAAADDTDLLRRLYFDLTGLPPSPQQAADYRDLAAQQPTEAYERLVDQLLGSPQFGVQWGRHWLDLMRYAETLGHEFDYPIRHAWLYRDAVVAAFNDDLPYRESVVEPLAGDLVAAPRLDPLSGVNHSLASTGWWWMGDSVHAPVDIRQDWATRLENQVDVLSKAFLGMTVGCAQCHDHKFDAISVEDYYGLVGIARSTRRRYAITDPQQRVAEHRQRLRQRLAEAESEAVKTWQSITPTQVQQWLHRAVEHWRTQSAEELAQQLPPGSPLYPLRLLVEEPTSDGGAEAEFARRAAAMHDQLRQSAIEFTRWQNESPLLADFRHGLPGGWTLEAAQPGDWSRPLQIDWFDTALPLPTRPAVLTSGYWGRQQHLTLRSPDFEVTQPLVCIKLRGKSTQSTVLVSNYFMGEFHGLLFGDLRKPIDQNDDWGWVVHGGDLNKYLGQPAFVSLENEPGAWFEVAELRLADRPPPIQPHAWTSELLEAPPASRDAFETLVVERLVNAPVALTVTTRAGNRRPSRQRGRSGDNRRPGRC